MSFWKKVPLNNELVGNLLEKMWQDEGLDADWREEIGSLLGTSECYACNGTFLVSLMPGRKCTKDETSVDPAEFELVCEDCTEVG